MTIPTNNPGTGSAPPPRVFTTTDFIYEKPGEFCSFHIDQSEFSFRIPFCQRDNASMARIASLFEAWREQFKTPEIK